MRDTLQSAEPEDDAWIAAQANMLGVVIVQSFIVAGGSIFVVWMAGALVYLTQGSG